MATIPEGFEVVSAPPPIPEGFEVVQPTQEDERFSFNEDIGPIEAATISTGRGFSTIGRGLGLVEPEDPRVTAQFEDLKDKRPVSTFIGELLGQTAPFLIPGSPIGAIASLPARVGASTALGASEGAIIARGEGRDEGQQAISAGVGGTVAGALELVLPRVSRIGRQVIRRVLKREPSVSVVDEFGQPSQEFVDALSADGKSLDDVVGMIKDEVADEFVEPEQIARKAFFESQGLQPTRAQITRSADDFQLQQEAAKTSGRVRDALEEQDAFLTTRFNNKILDTQGNLGQSSLFDAITRKADVLDQEITDLYNIARKRAKVIPVPRDQFGNIIDRNLRKGGEEIVNFSSLVNTLKKLKYSDRRSRGNVWAMIGNLESKGIIDKSMNILRRGDVDTAENIRIFSNTLFDPQNGYGNILLRQIKDAIDDDVFRAAGEDVFEQARNANFLFEEGLERAKISKFDKNKKNLLRDVLEGKITGQEFSDKVVFKDKWKDTDLKQVVNYIKDEPDGQQAINDLKADVLDTIKNKSFIGPEDAQGFKTLSRDKLEKAINNIGDRKLAVLFSPEERAFLRNMLKISTLREPVRGTQQGRGPSAQAIGRVEEKLKDLPLFGNLVQFIDIDAAGRISLKAPVQKKTNQPISRASIITPAAAALSVQTEEELNAR